MEELKINQLKYAKPITIPSNKPECKVLPNNTRVINEILETLGNKADCKHTHKSEDIEGLDQAIEDKLGNKADKNHLHTSGDIEDFSEFVTNIVNDKITGITFDNDTDYKVLTLNTHTLDYPKNLYLIKTSLSGLILNFPDNSVIKFAGGNLKNCTIGGKNLYIDATPTKIFDNITIEEDSVFLNTCVFAEWFGAVGDDITDDTAAILQALDFAYFSQIYKVQLLGKTYLTTKTLYVKDGLHIDGKFFGNFYYSNNSTLYNKGRKAKLHTNLTDKFSYAIESDQVDQNGDRFSMLKSFTRDTIVNESSSPYKEGPFHMSNIYMYTDNDTFGGIRLISFIYGNLTNLVIKNYKLGIFLTTGWSFVFDLLDIYPCYWGIYFNKGVTSGSINNTQITGPLSYGGSIPTFNNLDANIQSWYTTFITPLLKTTSFNPGYEIPEDITDSSKVYSVAIAASDADIDAPKLDIECANIAILGTALHLTSTHPYIEYIQDSIITIRSQSYVKLGYMHGVQKPTDNITYFSDITSFTELDYPHPGYFKMVGGYNSESDYSDYYGKKVFKINSLRHVPSNNYGVYLFTFALLNNEFVDWDAGEIVFVNENNNNEDNLGIYFTKPISLDTAMDRVNNCYGYRHVNTITFLSNATITSDYSIPRDMTFKGTRNAYTLTVNNPINTGIYNLTAGKNLTTSLASNLESWTVSLKKN